MLASRLPANTLQGMMDLCCQALCDDGDDGDTFYSQRVFDLFPQMATTNSGWAGHGVDGGSILGSDIRTDNTNDSDYIEWTVYVPAGNYKLVAMHTKTNLTGRADLAIDGGSVVDTLDTYNGSTVYNQKWTSAQFTVTEGSHTIRLTKNGKNGSSGGYTLAILHCQLVKQDTGSALAYVANIPHIIDIPVVFADSHTNWNTLGMTTAVSFGCYILSSGAQNATITISFWAPKGAFTLALLHQKEANRGIYSVAVDGGSIGTIDGYLAVSGVNVLDTTLTGTLTSTGIHTITFTMATKHASSSSYYGAIGHIQIRMTSITEPLAADLAPEVALLWPEFATSSDFTLQVLFSYAYYYGRYSSAQNHAITWDSSVLRPGTYRLDIFGAKGTDTGKWHLLLDTVDVGNVDGYNGSLVYNTAFTISSITAAGFSPHTVALKIVDKNASSSGYINRTTLVRLIRTGA